MKKFVNTLIAHRWIWIVVVAITWLVMIFFEWASYTILSSILSILFIIELVVWMFLVVLQFQKWKRYQAIIQIISWVVIVFVSITSLIVASMFDEDKDTLVDEYYLKI